MLFPLKGGGSGNPQGELNAKLLEELFLKQLGDAPHLSHFLLLSPG